MKKSLCFSILLVLVSIYSFGQNGFIDLKSEPKGATIFIDQKLQGQTPAMLELSPGKHQIKLELDGYETSTTIVEIVSDLVLNETIKLKALGKLSITTNPQNSNIYIDGRKINKNSPVSEYLIAAGSHSIKVVNYKIDGFQDKGLSVTKNINIQSSQTQSIHFNLLDELGAVNIKSTPSAKAYFNGEYKGTAPAKFENLASGDYDIKLTAYLDEPYSEEFEISKRVAVSPKKTSTLDVNFYDQFKLGALNLTSNINNRAFLISRLNSNYNKRLETKEKAPLLTGKYELQWTDTKKNTIQFDIFEDKITSVFAPVKKIYRTDYKLSDMYKYQTKDNYFSSNYKPLPESKRVSSVGYSFKYGFRGFDDAVATDYVALPLFGLGTLGVMVAGAAESTEVLIPSAIALVVGTLLAPFYKTTKTKILQSNINKNIEQRKRVNNDYEVLLNQLLIERDEKNKRIEEENKKIKEYNNALPAVEVQYESK
ncbi:PEGA domain-containing protein [uncultured Draconibacterium sp.]|uniref:PEGA domain-containing protein n=1 Tax=uncultured Draconibacterium sp. TaxID=1573823 RepID=UPI0032619E83